MKKIRLAFAVSNNETFEKRHFGDADQFLIYLWNGEELVLEHVVKNIEKELDETHGSERKGNAIVNLLNHYNVNALFSRQYGKNVRIVSQHFLPVKVTSESVADVTECVLRYMNVIEENLGNVVTTEPFTLNRIAI